MQHAWLVLKCITALSIAALALSGAFAADTRFRLHVQTSDPTRFYLDDSQGKLWAPDGAVCTNAAAKSISLPRAALRFSCRRALIL